jgi:hypothetical protein
MSNAADLFAPIAGDADPRATAGLELCKTCASIPPHGILHRSSSTT